MIACVKSRVGLIIINMLREYLKTLLYKVEYKGHDIGRHQSHSMECVVILAASHLRKVRSFAVNRILGQFVPPPHA